VGVGYMESHPGEHYRQIFQEVLHKQCFETDPKMPFYGRTMVKIKMIVTVWRITIQLWVMTASLMN